MTPPLQWFSRLAVVTLLGLNRSQVHALSAEYCSNVNTASGNGNSSIYQSNGLCYDFCLSSYAFAVLQGADCWCSDYVPGATTSTGDCNSPCNGYPDDLCGNQDAGLFGYLAIPGNAPSGTKGGTSATSTTAVPSTPETVTEDPNTVFVTLTQGPSSSASNSPSTSSTSTSNTFTPTLAATTTSSSTSSHSSSSRSSSTSSSSSSSMTWTPTPVTSLETITGQVHTVTVTPTIPPNAQNVAPITKKKSSGLSTGSAVGLTIGLVALVVLICLIVYFCWRRRQKEREAEQGDDSRRTSSAGLGGSPPSRTMSEHSRYVLNTDGRQVVESYEPEVLGSRRNRLMPVDPRLNPHAPLYQRNENKSRESVNTIRDDHDYSRRVHQQGPILRATNPDD